METFIQICKRYNHRYDIIDAYLKYHCDLKILLTY